MIHVDGEPYPHDRLVYHGYEMHVNPPIQLQQEVRPPYADVVIIRYLAERFGMSVEELAPTAQKVGDSLDRIGITNRPADMSDLTIMKNIVQEWLPDNEVTLQ